MRAEPCVPGDTDAVCRLEKECLPTPWSRRDIASAIDGSDGYILLKIVAGGELVAYGGVQIAADEASLTNIAVSGEFRRRGYASKLLSALMDRARLGGAKTMYLEVECGNAAAIGLYEKFGFEAAYTRKNYYAERDATVMVCKL